MGSLNRYNLFDSTAGGRGVSGEKRYRWRSLWSTGSQSGMASLNVCCKEAQFFLVGGPSSSAREQSPASFIVEYHITKKNRRVMKERVVNFANGCTK